MIKCDIVNVRPGGRDRDEGHQMSNYLPGDPEERAAEIRARRASLRATRRFEAMTVTVGELQVGDYIDVIPGEANVRGMRFGEPLRSIETRWDAWSFGPARRRTPVEAKRLGFGDPFGVIVPATFKAQIRRPVSVSN